MSEIIGTGLGFPLRVDRTGGVALVSGSDDINEAIMLILSTAPGERPMRPNFGCGIHDYIFESVDSYVVGRLEREIRIAIDRWEPRIELRQITIDTSNAADGELPIELEYVARDQRPAQSRLPLLRHPCGGVTVSFPRNETLCHVTKGTRP
jgi:phage baseplate assembly protein W